MVISTTMSAAEQVEKQMIGLDAEKLIFVIGTLGDVETALWKLFPEYSCGMYYGWHADDEFDEIADTWNEAGIYRWTLDLQRPKGWMPVHLVANEEGIIEHHYN